MSERIDTAARQLVDLKEDMERTAKVAEAAKKAYTDAERAFWEAMEEDLGKMKVFTSDLGEGYGDVQFQRSSTTTSTILDEEKALAALEAEGLGDACIGGRKIHKRVLNEEVRSRLERQQPLPPGIDFHTKRYITITRKG